MKISALHKRMPKQSSMPGALYSIRQPLPAIFRKAFFVEVVHSQLDNTTKMQGFREI